MKRVGKTSLGSAVEKKFNPSPKAIVIGVALFLGLLLIFGNDIKRLFTDRFQPRISFQEGGPQSKRERDKTRSVTQIAIFDGEVYRTETRLREASAVAIAASITGVAAYTERRPLRDVSELLNSMVQRGLLPPGVESVKEQNILQSTYSTIHIRFRPIPFAVEIVSLGRTRLDGPALILRVPEEKQNRESQIRYFYSLTLDDIKVPEPFAAPSTILSYGWQVSSFKPELPTGANADQLTAWASEQK